MGHLGFRKRFNTQTHMLLHKDKEKIDENFVQPISEKQKENVLHNVKMFRKMNRL